ncbi:hypothetical protein MMC17_004423 [Xylographa soralifera]|nr:hypothetical protein [Xylographa soralifera]
MTYTIAVFLWRAPHVTPTEFKTHYETKHIPLLLSVMGSIFPKKHTRYYLPKHAAPTSPDNPTPTYVPTVFMGTPEDFSYDVIAKLEFEDEKGFHAFFAKFMEPEVSRVLGEDEEKFVLRSMLRSVKVEDGVVTLRDA